MNQNKQTLTSFTNLNNSSIDKVKQALKNQKNKKFVNKKFVKKFEINSDTNRRN